MNSTFQYFLFLSNFRSQHDLCASKPTSDDVFTSEGATVSPGPRSSTQSEEAKNPLETGLAAQPPLQQVAHLGRWTIRENRL